MASAQRSISSSPAPHLRVALADPDPRFRRALRELLEQEPDVAVVGGCETAAAALDLVTRYRPALLFSAVKFGDMDGFELARLLDGQLSCGLIFVSRFPEPAVKAFEVHALDYLLKPVTPERLTSALSHARSTLDRRRRAAGHQQLLALLDHRDAERQRRARMLIRWPGGGFFLKTDAIDWLEAKGKRVLIHAGQRVFNQRDTLARIEAYFDSDQFVRISRSAIVNVDRIREIQPWFNGEYLIILEGGPQITSSRHYRPSIRRLLGKEAAS